MVLSLVADVLSATSQPDVALSRNMEFGSAGVSAMHLFP